MPASPDHRRTVDFGASDAPLTPEQAAACNGCVQIPWALTATGLGFHLHGVKKLNLSGPVIAGIYFGKITKWNDPKIKKLNPEVHLPGTPITPIYRSDGSGDTYAFTNYLSKVSKAWKNEHRLRDHGQLPRRCGRQRQRRCALGRRIDERRDRLHLGLLHRSRPGSVRPRCRTRRGISRTRT